MKTTLIVLVLTLAMSLLCSQPWEADNSIFNPSGIPSLTFSQPRFADLDGDGDMDFLLGNTNTAPLYIKNIGSTTNPSFIIGENLTANVSSLTAEMGVCVDIDADGDLDLITGGYTGLHLFLNTGSVTVPVFVEAPGFFAGLNVGSNPVPDLGDVDNDGDLDMVLGLSEDGGVRLYTNTGSATNAQFSETAMQVIGDVGLYAYPVFCDLDADGDQDILVGRDSHGFVYYRNMGSSLIPNWQSYPDAFAGLGMQTYWNSPDLVDLNNDGLFDLVFGTASGPLQYYVNGGSAANPIWQSNTSLFGGVLDVGGASSPVFYDFDGDGDLDMISGSQMGDIKYYENTGTVHAPAWSENSAHFSSIDHSIYAAVAIGDVNGDGLPDAIIGDLSGHLYYHRNTGMGFVWETGVLTFVALGGWSVPRLLDMDGDGDLDIVAGNEAGNLRYYENQGNPGTPNWVEITGFFGTIDVGSNCVPSFADIDGDGDWDFVAGNISGTLHCYLHQGLGWMQNTTIFSGISGAQNTAPALVDLDGDGDLDLVLGNYGGTFSYYRNLMYSGAVLNPPLNPIAEISDVAFITWEEPAAGSTSPFEHYKVYLEGDLIGTTTQPQWTFDDLLEGTAYQASITAKYVAGESLPVAVSWTMNIHNPPLDPGFQILSGQILISWQAPQGSTIALESYRVYVDDALYLETSGLDCTISDPINDHTYVVQITALYADGVESLPAILEILFTSLDEHLQIPLSLQNHPNPFNPSTTISFSFRSGEASLEIFNSKGQRVRGWKSFTPGTHSVVWDGKDETGNHVASGLYLYRLRCKDGTRTRKMILAK